MAISILSLHNTLKVFVSAEGLGLFKENLPGGGGGGDGDGDGANTHIRNTYRWGGGGADRRNNHWWGRGS